MSKKVNILFFETDDQARMIRAKLRDGFAIISGKQYMLDMARPIRVGGGLFSGSKDLYICKWDKIEPSTNFNKETGVVTTTIPKLERVTPEFSSKQEVSPEMLRKMMGMKILGNMIKTKTEMPPLLFMVLGLVLGVVIFFALQMTGLLKF